MDTEKYRIVISDGISRGAHDFESFKAFIDYLEDTGINKVSLMYHSIVNDDKNWVNDGAGIKIEHLTMDHFTWLSTRSEGETRYLEVDYKSIKPYVMETNMMHKKLMPFKEEQLKKYFEKSKDEHLEYFKRSIDNYMKYEVQKDNFPKSGYKVHRQAEKDERFYTTRTFIDLFERKTIERNNTLKQLLISAFGEQPPTKYPLKWDDLLSEDMKLWFEHDISAPAEYKEHLSNNLKKRHIVPYVLDAGTNIDKTYRKDLEGPTQVDAHIVCKSTDLEIIIEAKYLSDISCDVSYDVTRNQLARNIDVMLENKKNNSYFLLVTPQIFKDNPHTRLYGYKMNDYLNNHLNLMADLHHRSNLDPWEWHQITKRIAWITWEDLKKLGLRVGG